MKVTYGNDIEFHVLDIKRNEIVSMIPVLGVDKNNPIDLGNGIKFFHDNVLGETSFPPYNSKEEMNFRLKDVFSRIQNHLGSNYRLVPKAAHYYNETELKHPKALEIGCSPEFNAWKRRINMPTPFNDNLRTSGLHFHVGTEILKNPAIRTETVKLLDIFLGCSAVIISKDETEPIRKKYYGSAGSHRPTPYGLEFRSISTGILNSKEAVDLSFDLINYTLTKISEAKKILSSVKQKLIEKAINTCDKGAALDVLNRAKLPEVFLDRVNKNYEMDFYKTWDIKV